MLNLMNQGIALEKVNIGGMGAKRRQNKIFIKIFSASSAEKASLKKLIDTGATVTIQIIAEDKAIDVAKLLT